MMAQQSFEHELKADRKGVGFAYGGVTPGTLHARGQLVRTHTVYYSVGLAGKYKLHVGLRQQSAALPAELRAERAAVLQRQRCTCASILTQVVS